MNRITGFREATFRPPSLFRGRIYRRTALLVLLCALAATPLWAQRWSVSTNALDYLNFGTLNAEVSWAASRHWSLSAQARYNPFQFGDEAPVANRQRSFALGARWWPWHVFSGWFISAGGRYREYNAGGFESPRTEEGEGYGGSVGAGYAHMLSPHLNLEFGLGFWAGVKQYAVYSCPRCGITLETGRKAFVMPDNLLIALTYVF